MKRQQKKHLSNLWRCLNIPVNINSAMTAVRVLTKNELQITRYTVGPMWSVLLRYSKFSFLIFCHRHFCSARFLASSAHEVVWNSIRTMELRRDKTGLIHSQLDQNYWRTVVNCSHLSLPKMILQILTWRKKCDLVLRSRTVLQLKSGVCIGCEMDGVAKMREGLGDVTKYC